MNNVETTRPDYDKFLPVWKKNRDVVEAIDVDHYLRELEPALPKTDEHKKQRTKEYQDGAIFYPLVQQPVQKICAAAFKRDPVAAFPSDYLLTNCDGAGVGLFQQAKRTFKEGLVQARGALYVAVPPEGGDARINLVLTEQIINWRTEYHDGQEKLSLVVIKTPAIVPVSGNEFEVREQNEYLVLRYKNGVASGQRYAANADGKLIEGDEMVIVDHAGQNLDELAFYFFGELNNDPVIDSPTMYPLCNINIGHYRNSADFEEAAFYASNPVPYKVGDPLGQDQIDLLKANGISFGSKQFMPFEIGIAQASESTMSRTGMMDKAEAIANMLGNLIGVQSIKTATQVDTENDEKTNTLIMVAKNVSAAYVKAIEAVEMFNGTAGGVEFAINDEFIRPAADAQMLAAIVTGWMQGAVPMSVLYRYQKMHGLLPEGMGIEEFSESLNGVGEA